jgi:hypothetical integral membrane protein (TIGR02206 family)
VPFQRYGLQHLTVLAATLAASVVLALAVRRIQSERFRWSIRLVLALLLLGLTGTFLAQSAGRHDLRWWDYLPLQLCDMAIFVGVYALLTLRPLAAELLYFWGGAGTLIAMLTPDLGQAFPSWDFVFFFGLHAAVVLSTAVVTFGFDRRPRPRAAWRVFWITNAYAAVVGVVNALTGANFMYLRAKPHAGSLLDWLGPWPVYILAAQVVALLLFLALEKAARVGYSARSL